MTADEVAITEDACHIVPLIYDDVPPLPRWADVVIIGGGIMGTSIAFHLAEAGIRDIVVIERDTLGSGSSAKPLGGVRATFSDPGNIQLGQRSLEIYERFHEVFRTDIGLQQVGYLFVCRNEPVAQPSKVVKAYSEAATQIGGDLLRAH